MNAQEIYSIIKSGTPGEIKSFIENSPDCGFKNSALALAESANQSSLILGLTSMIMEYCQGSNPEFGASLAEATYRRALELFESEPDHGGLLPTTLSNLASQHLNALNYLGHSKEVIASTDTYLPYFRELGEMENYPTLVLARATALFNLNRIDESRELLENLDCSLNPGSAIGRDRLLNRIIQLSGDATALEAQDETPSLRQSMIGALGNAESSVFGEHKNLFDQLKNMLADEEKHASLDSGNIDQHDHLRKILDTGEEMLTRGNCAASEISMRKKSRDATAIFHPDARRKPEEAEIEASLAALSEVYTWATANNNKELLHDAIWGIYLCHSRLNRNSEAADALIELRVQLEAQRAGITDPVRRGGAFSIYPQLFNVSCERLSRSGRYFELLEAIEASKGRAIADILTRKQDRPVPDADVYGAVSRLPAMAQEHGFHYLSFYLDRYDGKAIVYSVMVCSDGQTYSLDPVRLKESLVDNVLENLDPDRWGKPGFRGSKIPDASSVLAPLADLIGNLHNRGIIADGDHICYTADEQLNNIPLHYLSYDKGLLIDYFTFSRIHNVAQLEYILEGAQVAPDHAEVFVVPTVQDIESGNWPKFEQSINLPAGVLAEYFDVQVVKNQQASIGSLQQLALQQAVLHFSTHGIREIGTLNPFTGSGLVISDGADLPDKDRIANGDLSMILTPQKLVDTDLDLNDSHVSLMACVSGLSREGLGGDALGLDWALVNAGARSILSSHWMVSAGLAAEFFENYYGFWLGKKQSKAQAYRNTIQAMLQSPNPKSKYQCSAFSLSGDWR